MSPSTYPIYDTLPEASDHLRLLTLHAGGVSAPIRCTLQTVSFSDKPSYEALSYTWGDPTITKPIEVDGFEIQVTANLEQALLHLREAENDLTLWVDAVCINQSDDSEKSHQVAFMGRIYRECDQVRIWLGCDSAKCRLAQSSLQQSNDSDGSFKAMDPFQLIRHLADDRHIYEWACFHAQNDDGGDKIVYRANDEFDRIIEAFITVTESPWWTRIWTVQEAILPVRGLLIYDTWSTSLESITNCGTNSSDHVAVCCQRAVIQLPDELFLAMQEFFRSARSVKIGRLRWNDGNIVPFDLQEQHLLYSSRRCQDPRDKVYGLLGIIDDIILKPNYTLPVDEVFLHVTCHILCHERHTLRSLTGPLYGPASGKQASWARQFDAPSDQQDNTLPLRRHMIYYDSTIFNASDGHESTIRKLQIEPDGT